MRMWRCSACGKWSHAQRKPKHHQQWVSGSTHTEPPVGATVTQEVEPIYDHLNGFTSDGGWFIECGPFEEWRAERVEAT